VGFINFTTEFKYLGSIIHPTLTSDADVDKRIKAATASFGALRNVLTNKYLDPKVKGQVYVALCLSILLYMAPRFGLVLAGGPVSSTTQFPPPLLPRHVPHYDSSHHSSPHLFR
jgi:hypothetical protein